MFAFVLFAPVPPMAMSSFANSLAVLSGLLDIASGPPFGSLNGLGQMPVTSGWVVAVPVWFLSPFITVLYWSASLLAVQVDDVSAIAAHQLYR